MNPNQLKRLFPNCSASVLVANSGDYGTGQPEKQPATPAQDAQRRSPAPAVGGLTAGRTDAPAKRAAGLGEPPIHENHPDRKIPHTEPQQDERRALEPQLPEQKVRFCRTIVRFTGYRVRPLDPDNFAGSVKELLDGLRRAHLIDGDEAWKIRLETDQVKVSHYAEEKTVVEIETP